MLGPSAERRSQWGTFFASFGFLIFVPFFFSTAVAARCGSADGSPYIYILMDSAPRYAENHSEPLRSGGGGCVCLTKPSTLYPIQLRPSLVPVYLVSHVPDKFLGFFVLFFFLGRPEGGWYGSITICFFSSPSSVPLRCFEVVDSIVLMYFYGSI